MLVSRRSPKECERTLTLPLLSCLTITSVDRFLVARLQLESVLQNARSVNSVFKELERLPSGLDDMYNHTLERIQNAQSPGDSLMAHRLFTILLKAARKLPMKAVQHALAVSFENLTFDSKDIVPEELIVSTCGGLVTVETAEVHEETTQVVRFIRTSLLSPSAIPI